MDQIYHNTGAQTWTPKSVIKQTNGSGLLFQAAGHLNLPEVSLKLLAPLETGHKDW